MLIAKSKPSGVTMAVSQPALPTGLVCVLPHKPESAEVVIAGNELPVWHRQEQGENSAEMNRKVPRRDAARAASCRPLTSIKPCAPAQRCASHLNLMVQRQDRNPF